MEFSEKNKKRRRRENSVKKWTEREIGMILDYIHETGNFEKPTAQIYYRKCLELKPLDATWDLIRWKVRSLKTSFSKANEWKKSTGAGLLETEEGVSNVKAKIQKICPYYDRLKEIFGDKSEGGSSFASFEVSDFLKISEDEQMDDLLIGCEEIFPTKEMTEFLSDSQLEPPSNEANVLPPTPVITQTQTTSTFADKSFSESVKCAEKLRKFAPKTAIGQLTQLQSERQAFQEKKLKLENEKLLQVADIEEKN